MTTRRFVILVLLSIAAFLLALLWKFGSGPSASCQLTQSDASKDRHFDLFYDGQNYLAFRPDEDPGFQLTCELLNDEQGALVRCLSILNSEIRVEKFAHGKGSSLTVEDRFKNRDYKVTCAVL
jgi:hypothetical protein